MRTTAPPTPSAERGETVQAVLVDMGRALGALRCAASQRLLRLGLSMTHFHVLTLLHHHEAMPMGRLAEVIDASMSSATGIIDRMEERGLVERVRVPGDRRVVLVRPTDAGRALVDEVELVKNDVLASALARLDPARLERFTSAMVDLRDAIAAEMAADPERFTSHRLDHDHTPDAPRPASPAGSAGA